MKHKHAYVLIAISEGKVVQWREHERGVWHDAGFKPYTPLTNDELQWRIKPEPKPDIVKYIGMQEFCKQMWDYAEDDFNIISHWPCKIKLTFDGETGKLKTAEVL